MDNEDKAIAQREAEMRTGVNLIAQERNRQFLAEGFSHEHDDTHTGGEMLDAAMCYIEEAGNLTRRYPDKWPWASCEWKPSGDKIRDLTKAGALIAAEIDRLQRAKDDGQ